MAKGDVVLDLEKVLFVLQYKNTVTGEWQTQDKHIYRGRTDANLALEKVRKNKPLEQWRSLQKSEAERYREGWKDFQEYFELLYEHPKPWGQSVREFASRLVSSFRSASRLGHHGSGNAVSNPQRRERPGHL